MDVSRLSMTLAWLRSEEQSNKIQSKLTAVQTSLQNLSSNPADNGFQTELTSSLKTLEDALIAATKVYDPAELDRIAQIDGLKFFSKAMSDRIKAQIIANPMSPATVLEDVNTIVSERKSFVDRVISTEEGIDSFIPYTTGLNSGESAVGFQIPRDLFDNDFKDFISELRVIQRIVRVLAETRVGSVPEIKLGQLSSTDPLVFLNAPPLIVMSVAAAISWVLSEWKKLEEIRKIRSEAAKSKQFKNAELEQFFDKKISENLDKAVKDRVDAILLESPLDDPRKKELESELGWALKALFARVERGMKVEVTVESLPKEDRTPEQEEQQSVLNQVVKIGGELNFPRIESDPILSLPKMNDPAQKGE